MLNLKKKCDEDIQELATSSFHSIFGNSAQDFHWGSNSESCLGRGIAQMYEYALTKDSKYRQAALSTLDYFFGRNATGYCYLTGFGTQRVMNIHHRISAAENTKEPILNFKTLTWKGGKTARYIRVQAKPSSFGGWLFVDEIIVK